jgi:hypothetical protein
VFWKLLELCPTPEAAVAADTGAIRDIIAPLGLHNKRAVAVQRLSQDFLQKEVRNKDMQCACAITVCMSSAGMHAGPLGAVQACLDQYSSNSAKEVRRGCLPKQTAGLPKHVKACNAAARQEEVGMGSCILLWAFLSCAAGFSVHNRLIHVCSCTFGVYRCAWLCFVTAVDLSHGAVWHWQVCCRWVTLLGE